MLSGWMLAMLRVVAVTVKLRTVKQQNGRGLPVPEKECKEMGQQLWEDVAPL
jgi:hypothetical protein